MSDKLKAAKQAIQNVFSDQSVTPQTTRARLEELIEEAKQLVDTLLEGEGDDE